MMTCLVVLVAAARCVAGERLVAEPPPVPAVGPPLALLNLREAGQAGQQDRRRRIGSWPPAWVLDPEPLGRRALADGEPIRPRWVPPALPDAGRELLASEARGRGIPRKLLLTSDAKLAALPPPVRQNVQAMLDRNRDLTVTWLDGAQCLTYLRTHGELLLATAFAAASPRLRSEICVLSVLLHDGGFYLDLGMELKVPLHELAEPGTSFVGAWSSRTWQPGVLPGLLGAAAGSPVLAAAAAELAGASLEHGWASGHDAQKNVPRVLYDSLRKFVESCGKSVDRSADELSSMSRVSACGEDIRMYQEVSMLGDLPPNVDRAVVEQAKAGQESRQGPLMQGIFSGRPSRFLGYTHISGCGPGCSEDSGPSDLSDLASSGPAGVLDAATPGELPPSPEPELEKQVSTWRIPRQLFFTGPHPDIEHMPELLQRNVRNTIGLNAGMPVTYFNDAQCMAYLEKLPDRRLALVFARITAGMFRSDLCRAAYLFHEGGFYTDLDVEVVAGFPSLVEPDTAFMSAWAASGQEVLNAIMGVEPYSPVLNATLAIMARVEPETKFVLGKTRNWGPVTLMEGLQGYVESCGLPRATYPLPSDLAACGRKIRMFTETDMAGARGPATVDRKVFYSAMKGRSGIRKFKGLHYGLFYSGQPNFLVGYSRFGHCTNWGCDEKAPPATNRLPPRRHSWPDYEWARARTGWGLGSSLFDRGRTALQEIAAAVGRGISAI